MAKNCTHDATPPTVDYIFEKNTTPVSLCYVIFSATGLLLNSLTIFTVLTSQRMRQAPKYWLVLTVSVTYWLQATLVNSQFIMVWFGTNPIKSCAMWITAKAYNAFVCPGISSWCSLLINLDYLFCIKSSRYRFGYRSTVVLLSTFACIFTLIAILCVLSLIYGSTLKPVTEVTCGFMLLSRVVYVLLLNFTVYIPLIGSTVFTLMVFIFCKRDSERHFFESVRILDASVDIQNPDRYKCIAPRDNALFLLVVLLCYLPLTAIRHLVLDEIISPENTPALTHLISAAAVARDNAGCLVPLIWFCFQDMRFTLKQLPCFKGGAHPSDSAFSESSEFRLYNVYPYCASGDMDL